MWGKDAMLMKLKLTILEEDIYQRSCLTFYTERLCVRRAIEADLARKAQALQ